MQKEMIQFISENGLNPFNKTKTPVKDKGETIYKTKDAKAVHNKILGVVGENFNFSDTSNLFNFFDFVSDAQEITKRKEFFLSFKGLDNSFLNKIMKPRVTWKPEYAVAVVTEDEMTFNQLQKLNLNCTVKFLISEYDLDSLEDYDVVQVVDCENFSRALENLPQAVFLSGIEQVYLERFLEELSGWKENLVLLKDKKTIPEIESLVNELEPLFSLIEKNKLENLNRNDVENKLSEINYNVSERMKQMTLSGTQLFEIMSKGLMPEELKNLILEEIKNTGLPRTIFQMRIPVAIDDEELERIIKRTNAEKNGKSSEKITSNGKIISSIPEKLKLLSDLILFYDFISGVSRYSSQVNGSADYSDEFVIINSKNAFLSGAQPISFHLNNQNRCSILTGANSGGKTTLLEHIIQMVTLFQLGLPVSGEIKMPLFSEVYYFAKNKGSMNKGAFETLLTQMSKITPGNKTLVLADEIESVTEPGVAGSILCASAEYFISKGCFIVIATHLGKDIAKKLPQFARIDGIEAKGLNENYELIVDHNPVLGRLANSTPELIVEKMANVYDEEYFRYLNSYLKRDKN
jgi:hypothetical protein